MNEITTSSPLMPDYEVFCENAKRLWESRYLTNRGPVTEDFEKSLAKLLKTENLIVVNNGTAAIYLGLEFLASRSQKKKVITTPFSFAATTNTIVALGLEPVFCDIDPDNLCLDTDKVENLINEDTLAIMPVHVYGNVCDVEKLDAISEKTNVPVIYDSAHAFMIEHKKQPISNYGTMNFFSLHATKLLNTCEGGIITFKNSDWREELLQRIQFGLTKDKTGILSPSLNFKMSELNALFGLTAIEELSNERKARQSLKQDYDVFFESYPHLRSCLTQSSDLTQPSLQYYPVLVDDFKGISRDKLHNLLQEKKITTRKYFYPLCNQLDYLKSTASQSTPIANEVCQKVLALPYHSQIKDEEKTRIFQAIREIYDA
ncbi:MAG: DegT/DnrJ/EryC1/StrS family aminotransferase [Bdellovibrionales bacterium]|nr:DegT/DnrJ/EryC1/StrS family aminotransferase [Bdellovibrionales bacterium]